MRAAVKRLNGRSGRRYEVTDLSDGSDLLGVFPSVTTVLGCWPAPQLEAWKLRQVAKAWRDSLPVPDGRYSLDQLARMCLDGTPAIRGSHCHRAVEAAYTGQQPDQVFAGVADSIRSAIDEQVTVSLVEATVVDLRASYAGTADLLGRDKSGNPTILDLKTGRNVWDNHWAQVHAYASATDILVGGVLKPMPSPVRAGIVHAPLTGYEPDSNGGYTAPKLTGPVTVTWLDDQDHARVAKQWVLALEVWKLIDRSTQ